MRNRFAIKRLQRAAGVAVLCVAATVRAGAAEPAPAEMMAPTITPDCQKLEGQGNQGTAAVEIDGARMKVAGAVAVPFAVGSSKATVAGQVRLLMPAQGTSPDFSSGMLALYGKDRSQRLMAFVVFKVPGMRPEECEVGFIAHKSIRVPAAWGRWVTIKLETRGGTARMKAWPDGAPEPDWMVEEETETILPDIDAAGVRTYAMPVLFEGFSVTGSADPDKVKFPIGTEAQGVAGLVRSDGSLDSLRLRYVDGWQDVEFRHDGWRGPGFGKGICLEPAADSPLSFVGEKDGVRYRLEYAAIERGLRVTATVENVGPAVFAPERLPLILGVNSFMNAYPQWNELYFPTFLRCEPTHFWGYLMSPHGRILGVASPDPVGSYTLEYLREMYAHHIYTASLDLLQRPPVPAHHPAYAALKPGERRSWSVSLLAIDRLDDVKPTLAASVLAPMLDIGRASLEPGQPAELRICSVSPVAVDVTTPSGAKVECPVVGQGDRLHGAIFDGTAEYGDYLVRVRDQAGKVATGRFFVHPPWSWYLQQGRLEALRLTPRADTSSIDGYSCETYYSLLGFYLAARHFPDPAIDAKSDKLLEKVLARLFKKEDGKRFSGNPERIQNGSFMVSLLVKRYQATGDCRSLEMAGEFAEYILGRQHKDGYYGGYGMHPYTAVIYPAKSVMELMAAEKALGEKDPAWKVRYGRHYASVKRAIDHLVAQGRDVKTEGAGTFEDGAVSCTASQIALFALLQDDPAERARYTASARQFLADHACLTRLLDPDCRSIGATLRWWEAWSDEKRSAQLMTSPHGWSGWRLYGVYYLYLLTGEEPYLDGVMNALGAGTQLLEWPSGRLRQAFVIDPHVRNIRREPDPANPSWGRAVPVVTCEDYIETIGDWWGASNPGTGYLDRCEWGWTGDGIPYEIFKAMEEIAVSSAYVVERPDGSFRCYNCRLERQGSALTITPAEAVVSRIHLNLRHAFEVQASFGKGDKVSKSVDGMQWIGPGGIPEDLRR